jgi:hypothetical protein
MSKEIYMQRTIDYIIKDHNHKLAEIESKGVPEIVELTDDKGNIINKYYKFKEM